MEYQASLVQVARMDWIVFVTITDSSTGSATQLVACILKKSTILSVQPQICMHEYPIKTFQHFLRNNRQPS